MSDEDPMIDKVAMAISMVDGFLSTRQCFDYARAAVEAMREPTSSMVEAGRWPAEDDGPVACWKAMIDAALAEPSTVLDDR